MNYPFFLHKIYRGLDTKNLINYYYGIIVEQFRKNNGFYSFTADNKLYVFMPFNENINQLINNYYMILKNNKYCHEIIVNRENSWITNYNGYSYILIKKNISIDAEITLDEIINFDIPLYERGKINWKELWEEKIDYYEYQMTELGSKYSILSETFNYYIGISENAIALLKYVENVDFDYYISHKRIEYKEKLDDFYSPLNILKDSYIRDLSEYIKNYYINNIKEEQKFLNMINNLKLDYTHSILFFARLLYPSYYFDLYDKILNEVIDEKVILNYTKKNESYETFLKKVYKILSKKYNIPKIDWLEADIKLHL